MSLKHRLRHVLGDLLEKTQNPRVRDRVLEHSTIKHILLSKIPAAFNHFVEPQSSSGFLRILAKDENNAKDIAKRLSDCRAELGILDTIRVVGCAIDHLIPKGDELPKFTHSVVIRQDPKETLSYALSLASEDGISKLTSEVIENRDNLPSRVVIDFSSPNIAKPFHFGHLKSTILGNYLANLYTLFGSQVTRLNYIGDWGTQYGLLSLGMDEFCSDKTRDSLTLRQLLDIYSKSNQRSIDDPDYFQRAKAVFHLMDKEKDSRQLERWRKIRDLSLQDLKQSYSGLGVNFDIYEYESDYAHSCKTVVEDMIAKNFTTTKDDGVVVANVEKNYKPHEVPVLKSDGSSLYITRDIAAAIDRKRKFNFDQMLYVVGSDQEKHFSYLQSIARNLGHDWASQLQHVMVGKVIGMSSRSGNCLLLSDIIDEATDRYIESTKNTVTSKVSDNIEMTRVGRQLALSSLFIYDMRNFRMRSYNFSWTDVTRLGQGTGLNIQTAYARLSSLVNKADEAGIKPVTTEDALKLDAICCIEASNLICAMNQLDIALHHSYWTKDASPLVNHAILLAIAINRARKSDRLWIMGQPEGDEQLTRTKLSLFVAAREQLGTMIKLFGLTPLDKV